jgi:hypothetical protein
MEGAPPLTDAERRAERFYWDNLRGKSGWERVCLACDLFEALKELCQSGIRADHPDWTGEQVAAAFKARLRQ